MMSDEQLAERIARADAGDDHWQRASKWSRANRINNWRDRIAAIRRAGLEVMEKEGKR